MAHKKDWESAQEQGDYICESLKKDGFIHGSMKDQVALVGMLAYRGVNDLVLLEIEEKDVKSKVIFEDLKGHGIFPHIYGKINTTAVKRVFDFPVDEEGGFSLPTELREKSYTV